MTRTATLTNLDNMTVRRLTYVITFALYAMLRNWLLPSFPGASGQSLQWVIIAVDAVTAGIVVGIVTTTLRRNYLSRADWGLQLRSREWVFIALICAAGVYFAIAANGISWKYAVGGLLIVLQFTTYELVFRAAIMNLLLKTLGDSLTSILLTVFMSALVYSAVLLPLDRFSGTTVGVLLVLTYLFYYARSIVLFVFLMAAYAAPNGYGIWVALFSILIYLGLIIAVRHWGEDAGGTGRETG